VYSAESEKGEKGVLKSCSIFLSTNDSVHLQQDQQESFSELSELIIAHESALEDACDCL
jgi:hypothetical protein